MPDTAERARAWLAVDPDPETRAELEAILAAGDGAALHERFARPLTFGTAGLRGALGAGPARMNRVVARRAAAGLGRWLLAHPGVAQTVVIGFDARHKSAEFAVDSAGALAALGVDALLFDRAVPTPVLAFAVRHLGCGAGVMVTASHNPAGDNGYKVYGPDGVQIAPPVDGEIAREIEAPGYGAVPVEPLEHERIGRVGDGVTGAYERAAVGVVGRTTARDLGVVYTPLHGVGGALALRLFAAAGFARVSVVPAQAAPDPDFPTAPFPNPEEPGVLDLALEQARNEGADLLLASDPDADRLAVAVPTGAGWRRLSGDEVGALLAAHLLARTSGPRIAVTSVVSSRLLSKMAAAAGVEYAETLTGFKWLMRPALARPAARLVLAYEEALGYAVSEAVRDKDGLTAALVTAELVAEAKAQGVSVPDLLEALAARFGLHVTDQWSGWASGSAALEALHQAVGRLANAPPPDIGGRAVTAAARPAPDVVVLELEGGARVVVRPSGTEPKVKAYFELVRPLDGRYEAARRAALADIGALRRSLVASLGLT